MKKHFLLIAVVFLTTIVASAQEINWVTLDKAVELQQKAPKKIMMDMYTAWCGPCKMLDRNTFSNPDVIKYVNTHYYAVKFNAEGNDVVAFKGKTFTNPSYNPARAKSRNSAHQLASYFQIRSYPTILFLDEKANFLAPIIGYKTPQDLELYLKMFKNNRHTEMTSQDAFNVYFKAFKPEFTN
ncbi:MAG: thioredoxin family protein [Bizionia sp.]|nr:thioredoxin family protein [Bizionia sp.]